MNIHLFWIVLFLSACTDPQTVITPAEPLDRPNIIWISAEDMGPRLGSYGDPIANTPHLDSLASLGTRYTRVFTTAGVCSPSRAAIITSCISSALVHIICVRYREFYLRRSPLHTAWFHIIM